MLLALKAGGTGLNLTAADHVFLLDPWWNPAVEDQAADRAHRIGQERPVFVYRLVAGDTVEEKILELQRAKRDLADAVIQADGSLLAGLSREDLEMLLSSGGLTSPVPSARPNPHPWPLSLPPPPSLTGRGEPPPSQDPAFSLSFSLFSR